MRIRVLTIVLISIFILMFGFNTSYASDIGDIFNGANNFVNAAGEEVDKDKVKPVSDAIYKILMALGISIAVIMSGILGIKFMIGSVEEKAKVQEQLIPYVIGCVVIFGAFTIWSIVVNIGNDIEKGSATYTKTEDGKLYCDACGDELKRREQRNGKCSNCDREIEDL